MNNGHAQAALESKEGAERARADYAAGSSASSANPYGSYEQDGGRHSAWQRQTEILIHKAACVDAGHDQTKCCWEHDRHKSMMNHSHWGIHTCSRCAGEEADNARIAARYSESHEHPAELCVCHSLGSYAEAMCRGTCHLPGLPAQNEPASN